MLLFLFVRFHFFLFVVYLIKHDFWLKYEKITEKKKQEDIEYGIVHIYIFWFCIFSSLCVFLILCSLVCMFNFIDDTD